MAKKQPDLFTTGLGDITKILHNQGVADLSWLAVDEADYRAAEALPRQNLDIIPEFQKALRADTEGGALNVPQLIPLRPHTIVNRNPLSQDYRQTAPTSQTAPIRNRVAKMVMMGWDNNTIAARLKAEFGIGDIVLAAPAIKEIVDERGLLGNVYINASHFPRACQDPKERKFARLAGKNAMFVIGGCDNSNGCSCKQTGICQTFGGKRVVAEVPYTQQVLAHYAPQLASERRVIGPLPIGRPSEYKETLRTAFLRTPIVARSESVRTIITQQAVPERTVTQAQYDEFWHRKFSAPVEAPSSAYMLYARKMMMDDINLAVLATAADKDVQSLVHEHGIIGKTYLDMDALGDCTKTLNLMHKLASSGQSQAAGLGNDPRDLHLDYIVRRSATCGHCKGAPDGACAQICNFTRIVNGKPPVTKETFLMALQRGVLQQRLTVDQVSNAGKRMASVKNWAIATAFVNLYNPPTPGADQPRDYTGYHLKAKTLSPVAPEVMRAQMDPEEVRRTISHMMNSGMSGKTLQAAILHRYSRDDLQQVPEVGRQASVDDGVQGIFFIDPTAYRDYGVCNDGAKAFRKRGAPNVLAADKCTGCMLQTAPGWCSKYAKTLIRQVPTQIRQAAMAAKRSLPVLQTAPVENPVEKYELANELVIEPAQVRSKGPEITIGGPTLDD